ncbi:MAG: nucleotide-binding protein [Candidatus Aenigmarchaeota archaeon]|nr:nucleotide-binding protein [Candidatus Aenigmarchaeota archaeon]
MILLDTNIILIPAQFKVDVFEELKKYDKLCILSQSIGELERLSAGKGKKAREARVGLELIRIKKSNIIEYSGQNTDKTILNYAIEHKCKVATNDKKLIKLLKDNNIIVFRLRQRKYFVEE